MNFASLYYDITKEIEIYELRLIDLESELKQARKLCFDGRLPSSPLPVHVPLDKALSQYDDIVTKIRETSDHLAQKKLIRQRIEDNLRDFKGVEHQVAFMRDVEGKPLGKIADELGYSYSYVASISSRIKKSAKRVQN